LDPLTGFVVILKFGFIEKRWRALLLSMKKGKRLKADYGFGTKEVGR